MIEVYNRTIRSAHSPSGDTSGRVEQFVPVRGPVDLHGDRERGRKGAASETELRSDDEHCEPRLDRDRRVGEGDRKPGGVLRQPRTLSRPGPHPLSPASIDVGEPALFHILREASPCLRENRRVHTRGTDTGRERREELQPGREEETPRVIPRFGNLPGDRRPERFVLVEERVAADAARREREQRLALAHDERPLLAEIRDPWKAHRSPLPWFPCRTFGDGRRADTVAVGSPDIAVGVYFTGRLVANVCTGDGCSRPGPPPS
ncbi:hypothetical protein [Natronorarus salvus]|uniref:hypothetical protein n=1 Tax=Natronorarus salvus TaxID=3117733 RepID=UPI002F269F8A